MAMTPTDARSIKRSPLTAKDEAHYIIYRRLSERFDHDRAFAMATAILKDLEARKLTLRRGER